MTLSFVQLFAAFLEDRSAWRAYLVDRFPHDEYRNRRSAEEMQSLAACVRALPADDPTLQRLAIVHRSNRDQYLPGERARYAIERYGFHEVTPPAMFLDDLVDLTIADAEDVPDGVPPVLLTWVRDRVGPGKWLHGRSEHAILATRGRPVVTLTDQTTVLEAPTAADRAKPDAFYALVDALCPGSKLVLFGAVPRPGWEIWRDASSPETTQPAESGSVAAVGGDQEDSAAPEAEVVESTSEGRR